jgi:hypothetical protein
MLRRANFSAPNTAFQIAGATRSDARTWQSELSLPDTVQQLDAGNGDRCVPKFLEAEHHSNALLHAPMAVRELKADGTLPAKTKLHTR